MEPIQNKSNSGTRIVIGILAFVGIAYLVSPEGSSVFAKSKTSKNIPSITAVNKASTCTMGPNGQSCGCGGGGGGCGGGKSSSCSMGTTKPAATTTTAAPTNNPTDTNIAYETVNVGHTAFALDPETVTLKAGKSYKLIITPTENGGGCMSTMTVPGLDENVYPIKAGNPITITINAAKAGTYDVVCGAMGMYQGSIIIS